MPASQVCLRAVAVGMRTFCASWINWVDLSACAISLALEVIIVAALAGTAGTAGTAAVNRSISALHSNSDGDAAAASDLAVLRALRPVARFIRVCRVGTRAFRQQQQMQTTARHVVGGNKRRFREGGFDLDLVYVTESIIGMSVPAVLAGGGSSPQPLATA